MVNYQLKDYTIPPDGNCVVFSEAKAEKVFAKDGLRGRIKLCQVFEEGIPRLFWVCMKANKAIATLPVFKEEENLKTSRSVAVQICHGNELICHDDVFYVTSLNAKKQIRLNMVQCFLSEDMVRLACALRDRRVISVSLVKIYDSQTGKDIAPCWQVSYYKETLDCGYFFVDLRDGIVYEDYDFSNTETYDIGIGDTFLAYNSYYTLKKAETGSLYLQKSHIQLILGGKYGTER